MLKKKVQTATTGGMSTVNGLTWRILFFLFSIVVTYRVSQANEALLMATTTSTDNTGLLDYLVPHFEKETGISLRWVAVGTGKALRLGRNCDVDVLLVHAPDAEKEFMNNGFGAYRHKVMYNDFVIVGPPKDPAKALGLSPILALKRIAEGKALFLSRGDNSGTNKKERSLWEKALGRVPERQQWYLQTGRGMLATLMMAAEKGGYTLTDQGTWIKYRSLKETRDTLKIMVEGDPILFNQYSVIIVNPERCQNIHYKLANQFVRWIIGKKAQELIKDYKLLGKTLFVPNAHSSQ